MRALVSFAAVALLNEVVKAGTVTTVLWSGNFDYYSSVSDFDTWSWSNEVGEYQWYIHGSQETAQYLDLSSSYKNPADTCESKGLKLTVDSTSTWNSNFERTELIPQTTANLGTGQLYYHFSLMQNGVNAPNPAEEHQIFFFESHFTELKIGVSPNTTYLSWCVGGTPKWSTPWTANTWYNFAYDIDFSAGTVGLWASTDGGALVKVFNNVAASTSTNSADFHVGVLNFLNPSTEDYYISGVYVESGSLTTDVSGNCGSTGTTTSSSSTTTTSQSSTTTTSTSKATTSTTTSATTTSATTTSATTTSSASSGTGAAHYAQCGGIGWTGATACVSPYTCTKLNDYYSQCL